LIVPEDWVLGINPLILTAAAEEFYKLSLDCGVDGDDAWGALAGTGR
jgi:hypothetical protein